MRALPVALAVALAAACRTAAPAQKPAAEKAPMDTPPPAKEAAAAPPAAEASSARIAIDQAGLVSALVQKHGEDVRPRAERGVRQVAAYWRKEDGDAGALPAFVEEAFVKDPRELEALLRRFSAAFEQIDGHMLEIGRALKSWSELELGPQMEVDQIFAAVDVSAHLPEDLFSSRLAFIALLNFPQPDLQEMVAQGPRWSRQQWAVARLTRRFAVRPSGAALQAVAKATAEAEAYIAGYNVWMHHVLAPDGRRLFPKGVRLLTHWNLRDQIKADYAEPDRPLALASKAGARGDGTHRHPGDLTGRCGHARRWRCRSGKASSRSSPMMGSASSRAGRRRPRRTTLGPSTRRPARPPCCGGRRVHR